jgi:hypothetical protein
MQGQNETAVVSSEQPIRSRNLIPGSQQPDRIETGVNHHPAQFIHVNHIFMVLRSLTMYGTSEVPVKRGFE